MTDIDKKNRKKATNDFVTGLITFIIFIVFMIVWMYFGTTG